MARAIPIDLVEAVQQGEVSLEARPENSFAETRLKLENKTSQQLELDLSRSGLIPKSGDAQRIGLCHPVGFQPGDYVLAMKPKQSGEIVVVSRCLDSHRPPPDTATTYNLLPELLPAFIVEALRQAQAQEALWRLIEEQGGAWGEDKRPVPTISHQALIGTWPYAGAGCTISISWNPAENRYEGHLLTLGDINDGATPSAAYVGFSVGELCYLAYPTDNPAILKESVKWRWGLRGTPMHPFEQWREDTVNMANWKSWNVGVFGHNAEHVRIA